jgi:adenine-specific DNA-methyltransferase
MNDKLNSIRHRDKRANIPTNELRGFMEDEEKAPKTMRYPRDPSLDPQLVWKGKDEQDGEDLAVPMVPVYIQEKIHPQAIIEAFRAEVRKDVPPQADLFADFNGIPFADQIEFCRHEQNWSNRMILGDSLLVMTSLAEKEGLKGKVQMIYMDSPYGIQFGSNWQVSTRRRDVKDGKIEDATREPEVIKAFRDTWALGIHSYLTYLRDRLVVARDLLSESGSIFVQIGDENVHLVRSVLDEIYGSRQFCGLITFTKTGGQSDDRLANVADFVIWHAKDCEKLKYRQIYADKLPGGSGATKYNQIEIPFGERFAVGQVVGIDGSLPEGSRLFRKDTTTSQRPPGSFPVVFRGKAYGPQPNYWKTGPEGFRRLIAAERLTPEGTRLAYVRYLDDFPAYQITNVWSDLGGIQSRSDPKVYAVQTNATVIKRCLLMTTDPGDLVVDPTCGSGTTAYVAEQWGRRWITIDTSRVALALARTRLMSARYPYYLLADSVQGLKKEAEITGRTPPAHRTESDIRKGFVYKRVPHVTLKSIANNPEIDSIHAKWQEKLEPIRAKLNALLGQSWEEWDVPRRLSPHPDPLPQGEGEQDAPRLRHAPHPDPLPRGEGGQDALRLRHAPHPDPLPSEREGPAKREGEGTPTDPIPQAGESGEAQAEAGEGERLLAAWWELRRQRQAEIDASIARNAETELLYDQPCDDPKRVRVAGPFTVESLSPHRVLAADLDRDGEVSETKAITHADFIATLIEHLRKAGIQNTKKAERLKFDRLESFAGTYIQAEGETTDATGAVKRIALCFGPENGTVGPELIREAAKDAVQGLGFDLLYVLGFAFDPHASEETLRYRRPIVQIAKMNPDLAMGDALLKKTGSGNLFMVFGEPDIEIRKDGEGRLTIEIKGVDVYDPA